MRIGFSLLMCCTVLLSSGLLSCGSEAGPSQITTALLIPQTLAEELATIEIYLFETERSEPAAESLLNNENLYRDYKHYKMVKYPYPGTSAAVMDGIPDRGNVWRFYARGLKESGILIGHGATPGLYDINPDSDTPLQVDLTLIPIN